MGISYCTPFVFLQPSYFISVQVVQTIMYIFYLRLFISIFLLSSMISHGIYQQLHRYTIAFRRIGLFSTSATRAAKKKMPPKKALPEKKVLLGRPGNNLKIGIVGVF